MAKAKKKPARKRSTKAAVGGAVVARRAAAYSAIEPQLCDCVRWAELAETLSLDHDRSHYDIVVRHLAEKMEKLRAAYYEMDGYEL